MKIVCFSDRAYGCGASIAGYRLAQGFVAAGHRVYWCFAHPFDGPWPPGPSPALHHLPGPGQLGRLEGAAAQLHPVLFGQAMRRRWRKYARSIDALLDELQPDILFLHNIDFLLNHQNVLRLADRHPLVWLIHSNGALEPYHYRFKDLTGKFVTTYIYPPALVDAADQRALARHPRVTFVAPSRWLYAHNRRLHGEAAHLEHIPNGLDPTHYYPPTPPTTTTGPLRVLFVAGNLAYPRKNLALLTQVLAELPADQFHSYALGAADPQLQQRYPNIKFIPPSYAVEDLRKMYQAADVFVIPSLIDNLPNTVLESLFCGTPVIGSHTGGVPDMVVPGHTGLLFDPYDAASLRTALLTFYNTTRHELSGPQTIHDWGVARFSLTKIVARYEALFMRLLDD